MTTVSRLARVNHCFVCDGLVFKWQADDADFRQHSIADLLAWLEDQCDDISEKDFKRLVKVHIFNMAKDHTRAIAKVEVFGTVARCVNTMPLRFANWLVGMHVKTFFDGITTDEFVEMCRHINDGVGFQQPVLFGPNPHGKADKGTGRGLRIGDRESGFGMVLYERAGQRPGLELRVQKGVFVTASRAIREVLKREPTLSSGVIFTLLFDAACLAGTCRLDRELLARGTDLGEYAPRITSYSSRAVPAVSWCDLHTGRFCVSAGEGEEPHQYLASGLRWEGEA